MCGVEVGPQGSDLGMEEVTGRLDLGSVDCSATEFKWSECIMENRNGGMLKKILLSHKCNIALLSVASSFNFNFKS